MYTENKDPDVSIVIQERKLFINYYIYNNNIQTSEKFSEKDFDRTTT